jgi:hypothetical protein
MNKSYYLPHLIGPALRKRRLDLGISEETIFEKTFLKISAIEKSGELRYNELLHLCKYYHWSLIQLYAALEWQERVQKKG